jgi:aspartate aminotransferase
MVQKAALAALTGPQDCVVEMKKEYISLRDQILAGLETIPGIKCSRPEGAFYVYPNISALLQRGGIKNPAEFAKRLLHESHLATVPGEGFGTHEHIRISYATKSTELDRGIERLRSFVSSL